MQNDNTNITIRYDCCEYFCFLFSIVIHNNKLETVLIVKSRLVTSLLNFLVLAIRLYINIFYGTFLTFFHC